MGAFSNYFFAFVIPSQLLPINCTDLHLMNVIIKGGASIECGSKYRKYRKFQNR